MQKHIQLLGIIYIFFNAIGLIVGWFAWSLLTGIGVMSGDAQAAGILTLIGTVVGGIILTTSLPGILFGIGCLKGWWWARYLGFVLALFNLLNVPLGTMLAIYTFWVLLQDETIAFFDGGGGGVYNAPPAA